MASRILEDIRWHTDRTFSAVEGIDKVCKLVRPALELINVAIAAIKLSGAQVGVLADYYSKPIANVVKELSQFGKFVGALGFFTFLNYWVGRDKDGKYEWQKDWQEDRVGKIANRVLMMGVKTVDMLNFLESIHLIKLGMLAAKYTFRVAIAPAGKIVLAPVSIVKDLCVIAAAGFSIWDAAQESAKADRKVAQAGVKLHKWEERADVVVTTEAQLLQHLYNKYNANNLARATADHADFAKLQKLEAFAAAIAAPDRAAALQVFHARAQILEDKVTAGGKLTAEENKVRQTFHWFENELATKELAQVYRDKAELKSARWTVIQTTQTARNPLIKDKSFWTQAHEIGKIAVCVIGIVATILVITSVAVAATPYLIAMAILGLTVAALDYNKYRLNNKITDMFAKNPLYYHVPKDSHVTV